MEHLKYVKAEDIVDTFGADRTDQVLDLEPLLGNWINTNSDTNGINRIVLTARENRLILSAVDSGEASAHTREETPADCVYASSITSRQASAFSARYCHDIVETHLLANLSLGLLVVASATTVRNERGRPKAFSREFFHR